jgi:hypothetical protein
MKSKALPAVILFLSVAAPASLLGRGIGGGSSFGGGGRSFGSSGSAFGGGSSRSFALSSAGASRWGGSSFSSSNPSAAASSRSSWGSSSRFSNNTPAATAGNGFFGSNSRPQTSTGSRTDLSLARKVGQGGAQFSSRDEAVRDFQQKYATSYPSTFSREPSFRPSYIPQTIIVSGNPYPIYYDWSHGGYGYWSGSTWTAYNVLRDTLMLETLMSQNNYSYGYGGDSSAGYNQTYNSPYTPPSNPPYSAPYNPPYNPVYYPAHHDYFGGMFSGFSFIILLIIGANIVRRISGF